MLTGKGGTSEDTQGKGTTEGHSAGMDQVDVRAHLEGKAVALADTLHIKRAPKRIKNSSQCFSLSLGDKYPQADVSSGKTVSGL